MVDQSHGLMLLWFTDLMNVTEEVTIHRPNVSTLLSSAFLIYFMVDQFLESFILYFKFIHSNSFIQRYKKLDS